MTIIITFAAFLVAIGILVAVHEFGHYWVAKKLGFKVLRFFVEGVELGSELPLPCDRG